MKQLSFGKYRGLQCASTSDGLFTILAIDHQDALRRVLQQSTSRVISDAYVSYFKQKVVSTCLNDISGVLIDPVYGAFQIISNWTLKHTGLLIELEKADYQMNPMPLDVEIDPDWSVAKIKRLGADGVKLFFYYNPFEKDHAARQKKIIRQVVADCDKYDIPLYAEPIVYGISDEVDKQTLVIQSAKEICELGVDVLKLEFPVDVTKEFDKSIWLEACEKITEAIDIPWVLLSAGVSFEIFAQQLEIACKAGASGFIVGRALWGDAAAMRQNDQLHWLKEIAKKRLDLLNAIVGLHGKSWPHYYNAPTVTTDTFRQYAAEDDNA